MTVAYSATRVNGEMNQSPGKAGEGFSTEPSDAAGKRGRVSLDWRIEEAAVILSGYEATFNL